MSVPRHRLNDVFPDGALSASEDARDDGARMDDLSIESAVGGFASEDRSGDAYDEEAFHYFLEIERQRAGVSNRPFLLMLIDLKLNPIAGRPLDEPTAETLFAVLSRCLRETDFFGWYRNGRVAGAVLTQHEPANLDDLSEVVRRRVCTELEKHFQPDSARGLQVRVYHVSKFRSE